MCKILQKSPFHNMKILGKKKKTEVQSLLPNNKHKILFKHIENLAEWHFAEWWRNGRQEGKAAQIEINSAAVFL